MLAVTSVQRYSLNKRWRLPRAGSTQPRTHRVCTWSIAVRGKQKEHVRTWPKPWAARRGPASAHHVIAASVLLDADVACRTLGRQKGTVRLACCRATANTHYTEIPAHEPSSERMAWALLGRAPHLNMADCCGWNSNSWEQISMFGYATF